MMLRSAHSQERGFALFIVAVLFVAFAMVAVAMIDRTNATKSLVMVQQTQTRMSKLTDALHRYSLLNNNRYPCPASVSVAVTGATFGQATANCQDTASTPSGTTLLTGTGNAILRGMVPVRELLPYGIDPMDAFDAWGNRIMYVIDRQMTPLGSGASPTANRPVITDSYTGSTVTFREPDYILMSYGRDGVGGIPKNTTSVAISCVDASTEVRMANCDSDDLQFVVQPINIAPGTTSALYFDDILRFYAQ